MKITFQYLHIKVIIFYIDITTVILILVCSKSWILFWIEEKIFQNNFKLTLMIEKNVIMHYLFNYKI